MVRALVQKVLSARVTVDGKVVGQIGKGICVLVGISRFDTPVDSEFVARKILNLRVFGDEKKHWTKNVMQMGYEVLLVSQFTLYATLKGNKPDFHEAMGPDLSKAFYENFVKQVKKEYREEKVQEGVFGAMMQVELVNDGPVTMMVESGGKKPASEKKAPSSQTKPSKPAKKAVSKTNPLVDGVAALPVSDMSSPSTSSSPPSSGASSAPPALPPPPESPSSSPPSSATTITSSASSTTLSPS